MSKYFIIKILSFFFMVVFSGGYAFCSENQKNSKVIAFYTGKNDPAHISFVKEANQWFEGLGQKHHFLYDSTNDWSKLTDEFLSKYDVVIFLDSRPDSLPQREAFQNYMEKGGAWIGFHFCAFALSPSKYPQNWDWYHNTFLGAGQYKSNTWRPTSAILKVERKSNAFTKGLPETFTASPNEWYRWEKNLHENPAIQVLVSIHPESFPLGTGPKPHEIWHSGDYPVVWTNTNYRMIYINMGHNDIDYESGSNSELSFTFQNKIQNKLVLNALKVLMK